MTFHYASEYCYNWIQKQTHVKEESLTDWLLFFVEQNVSNIYYKTFTRNEESLVGADWEWWIVTGDAYDLKAYRLLIQAKKTKKNEDNYPLVSYANKNGFQIDLLIKKAIDRGALPLYAYYSNCQPDINKQELNINYIDKNILRWCETCKNGCFLSSAFVLRENIFGLPRRRISEEELINASFGLSLLDYLFASDKKNRELFLQGLNSHFINSTDDNVLHNGIIYQRNTIPDYIKYYLQNKGNVESWYEREFKSQIGDINGFAVIDIRKGE